MTLAFGPLRFSPAPLPTLAVLLLLPLLLWLGFWQLGRAAEKTQMLDVYRQRLALPPAPLGGALDLQTDRYRQVELSGRYDSERQILLDNQLHRGRPGYHVYTPLLVADGAAVLVNRGWIPWGESRQTLPDLTIADAPAGTALSVQGRLDRPANPGLALGGPDDPGWPLRVQHIDYRQLAERLGYPLYPAVILLGAEQPHGYRRDWQVDFGVMTPDRHRGYALQWFGLAAALLTIYGVMNLNRRTPADAANDNPRTDP